MYGLKQAPRCWNLKFTNFLKRFNLKASAADSCVFIGRKIIIALYIDDGLIAARYERDINSLLCDLKEQFKFKSGSLESFVGLEVIHNPNGCIHIRQSGYAERLLQKFRMSECNPVATPADMHHKMRVDGEPAKNEPTAFPYREAVGSLDVSRNRNQT